MALFEDMRIIYVMGYLQILQSVRPFGKLATSSWGKQGSARAAACWATVWSLIVELGMMLGPPMGPMVGLFGMRYAWPQLFLLTLVAHMAFGIALGLLAQALLKDEDRGGLLHFLQGQRAAMVS